MSHAADLFKLTNICKTFDYLWYVGMTQHGYTCRVWSKDIGSKFLKKKKGFCHTEASTTSLDAAIANMIKKLENLARGV